jgi:WD40 repeat protein
MVLENPSRWQDCWVVRELATGREQASSPPLGRRAAQATASADGRWVAGIHTKHLLAWRPDDPGAPPVLRLNDGPLHFTGLAFHPSGAYLATTSNDATVRVYDTTGWAVARTYAWQAGKLRCVAFSPDGMLAAVGSDSGNIVVWDVDL